jgi:hypothetical protein
MLSTQFNHDARRRWISSRALPTRGLKTPVPGAAGRFERERRADLGFSAYCSSPAGTMVS